MSTVESSMLVTEQYVSLATSKLFVKTLGQSTKRLLVIHGGPDWDHSYLVPAFIPLANNFEIIFFDIRGCGKSQKFSDSNKYSIDLIVNDIKNLMDALHLKRCNLLGFSFGGSVALQFFTTYPKRVNSLILASTTAYSDCQIDLDAWDEFNERYTNAIHETKQQLFNAEPDPKRASERLAYETLSLDIYNLNNLPQAKKLIDNIRFSGEWMQAFRDHQLQNSQTFNHLASLRQHPVHLFAIHGEKDMRFPISVAKQLKQEISACQLAIIPNAGHLSYIDKPVEWQEQLSRFLSLIPK